MGEIGKILYPQQFKNSRILTHPRFEKELIDILDESGFKQKFASLYRQRLMFLEERWKSCKEKRDWFEVLKKTDDELYSMKFKSLKNIRIIFTFTNYKRSEIVLLLCTFEEKDSKNNSKGSYNIAIESAYSRLKEINDLLD